MTQLAPSPAPANEPVVSPAPAGETTGARRVLDQFIGPVTTILGLMLLAFVVEMAVIGPVKHVRNQAILYQDFRAAAANAVAPTGQLDSNGKLVELGTPVAVLRIPSIGLREVVAEGTTSRVLTSGPGHRRDSVLPGQPGNSIIFGRQATYGGPFGRIADLKKGAEIAVVTGQGPSLYRVTGIRRAGDTVTGLTGNQGRLTLITGDGTPYLPGGAVSVDAELVSAPFPASPGPLTATSLAASEGAMKGDPSALLPLLLWSQLLLLAAVALTWIRSKWGRWQSWIVCVPVLGVAGFKVASLIALLLPNLL